MAAAAPGARRGPPPQLPAPRGRCRAGLRRSPPPSASRIGFARQSGVQRFEALRRSEQERRSVAATSQGESELRAQPLQPGALELVERALGRRSPAASEPHRAHRPRAWPARPSAHARPRSDGIRGQRRGSLEERGSGRKTAACLRAVGRALELRGDFLVRPGRGLGAVPRAAIGIDLGIGAAASARCTLRRSSGDAAR